MYTLKGTKTNYSIKLPKSLNEITDEVLTKLTEHIELPNNYAIIACCIKTNLVEVCNMNSMNNVNKNIKPIYKLAKYEYDKGDSEKHLYIGSNVIINKSAIEMGTHINIAGCNYKTINKLLIENNISSVDLLVFNKTNENNKNDEVVNSFNRIYKNPNSKGFLLFNDKNIRTVDNKQNITLYLIELKIVPINDIKAKISDNENNPFIEYNNN